MQAQRRVALISVHGDPAATIGAEQAGGQNVYVREVGRHLAALGHQVDMFTRRISPDQPEIVQIAPGCRVVRLAAGPLEYTSRDHLYQYLPAFVTSLLQFVKKQRLSYEAVHTNYWLSGQVGLMLREVLHIPQIHTYHSLGAVKYLNVTEIPSVAKTRLKIEKAILETAERVVATSPQEEAHMRQYVSRAGRIDVIPCGVDIENFQPVDRSAARKQLGWGEDEKILFYVGRFDRRKGIETLVRAAARLSYPVRLVIGGGFTKDRGDGLERERIGQIVESLGLAERTVFPGRLDQEDLATYYSAADATVVPSHYEPFGLVAVEAMACGTPVVASKVGGLCYSIVHEETGLLVPPRDEMQFAEAFDRILTNPALRDKLGEASIRRIHNHFTWAGVSRQLGNLYKRLAVESNSQRSSVA
ncbi:MAG: glycosyltransferase family 1 protein [Gemmatimonadaceae bacterium]|nr:glycosyltransferase family 1 protein [Gloeobacterales cyanobacterium ES-bin-141]